MYFYYVLHVLSHLGLVMKNIIFSKYLKRRSWNIF